MKFALKIIFPALQVFCACFVLICCKSTRTNIELKASDYPTPPGTVKISDNLFLDQAEISNLSYLEFMWWTYRVHGKEEYVSILPDTSCWIKIDKLKCPECFQDYYLRHPSFRLKPVVGVSYTQALKFCKWRSDRVMEFFLISRKIIPHNPNPKNDSVFTIEKYFQGKYLNISPSPYVSYYPEYSLPDATHFTSALRLADSINKIVLKRNMKCNNRDQSGNKMRLSDLLTERCLENIPGKTDVFPYGLNPTQDTYCESCDKLVFFNLLGNVRELTNRRTIIFGASFYDSCSTMKRKYIETAEENVNAYTGFRNICTWKRWTDK